MSVCETIDFDVKDAFENWVAIQRREYDSLSESVSEFEYRMDAERAEFESGEEQDWWIEELGKYTDITGY